MSYDVNKNKMLKSKHFQKNKLYTTVIFNFLKIII
jgi:hypothetical protein